MNKVQQKKMGYLSLLLLLAACSAEICFSENTKVQSIPELRSALVKIAPGSVIEIMPGHYDGGFRIANVHGRADSPIVITGADINNPPVFEGLGEGLKVSSSSYIKFKNILFRGFPTNGINIDDSGNVKQPSHHILLENIRIENIGAKGNHDALKMAGVNHFILRGLRVEGWGGSAIDLVGCHNGVIEGSRFVYREGYRSGNSIQIKGGSRFILVQNNLFENSGSRIVQIGGLTGLRYFRPMVENYEAKDVIIAGNTFIGGGAQIAWATAQNSYVSHNLFYAPQRWLGRILQESEDKRFLPCQRGVFEKNLIVINGRMRTLFNIGKDTRPESFVFRGNVWNRPAYEVEGSLPSAEVGGVYGLDPMLQKSQSGQLMTISNNPILKKVGPWAYRSIKFPGEFDDIRLPSF